MTKNKLIGRETILNLHDMVKFCLENDFFDEIDKNPNKDIDNINLMYLKDGFKSIKLTKIEIKNLKEELKNDEK